MVSDVLSFFIYYYECTSKDLLVSYLTSSIYSASLIICTPANTKVQSLAAREPVFNVMRYQKFFNTV